MTDNYVGALTAALKDIILEPNSTEETQPPNVADPPDASSLPVEYTVFDNLADEIMANLPIVDVVRLGNTNRNLHALVPSHVMRSFQTLLQQYFPHPLAFRDAMRDTGTILSGSNVLSFIMRDTHWAPGDLDIYCPEGSAATRMMEHLEIVQGFVLAPADRQHVSPQNYDQGSFSIDSICTFERMIQSENSGPRLISVDLIESSTRSSVKPVTGFHSTVVMNYITADAIVILYPLLTSMRIGAKQPRKTEQDWAPKYAKRGFALLEYGSMCGSSCPDRVRSSHDSAALHVTFGSPPSNVNEHLAYSTRWQLGVSPPFYTQRSRRCENEECPYSSSPEPPWPHGWQDA